MAVDAELVSPSTVRRLNRSRILRTLYAEGPMARVDLAHAVGATRATVGQIVQPLLDNALLEEGEPRPSAALGGRRARPLWFTRSGWTIAAVHLLPGLIRAATVSASGEVLEVTERRFDHRETVDPEEVIEGVVAALHSLRADLASAVRGIGIAIPGMVDTDSGEIVRINLLPGLAGVPMAGRVAERVGVPVSIDLHPRAQALGDLLFGQGRGLRSFISLYTGEALGAGLILDGSLHSGPGGAGGEVGHTFVDTRGEPCHCGQRGCWETIATYGWLRNRAATLELDAPVTSLTAGDLTSGRGSDPVARRLLGEYARNLAYGIANLHQVVAPEVFIVHGDVVTGGEDLRAMIEQEVAELVPQHPSVTPRVVLAPSDDYATLRGAASIALFQTLDLDL